MKTKRTTKQPLTVVSVDWDYFLPCDIDQYDWKHNENSHWFYEFMWGVRASNVSLHTGKPALEAVQVDPAKVAAFWDKILAPGCPLQVAITDSHKDIVSYLGWLKQFQIVNFDAHHDTGYGPNRDKTAPLHCGNWVTHLRAQKKLKHYHLVYPEWRKEWPERSNVPLVDALTHGEWREGPICASVVFLCRSSCWMPSWCDPQWLVLREGLLKRKPVIIAEAPYVAKAREF